MTPPANSLAVRLDHGGRVVRVQSPWLAQGNEVARLSFLARVLASGDVERVDVDSRRATATIYLASGEGDATKPAATMLTELAAVVRGKSKSGQAYGVALESLPQDCLERAAVTIRRYGSQLTTWEVIVDRPDSLRLRHPLIRSDRTFGGRVERMVATMPGVQDARLGLWTADTVVRFDPVLFDASAMLAVVQTMVNERSTGPAGASKLEMLGTSASLAVAAITDFLFPALYPLSAALLVGTNIRTISTAVSDLRRHRIGLATVFTAITIGTLSTGQFLASGLMAWSFDFWRRRHRRDIDAERQLLLEDAIPMPACSRVEAIDGTNRMEVMSRIHPGDQICLEQWDLVPADGHTVRGSCLVDERFVRGTSGVRTVRTGERLLAGAMVVGGNAVLVVEEPPQRTRLASIGRAVTAATRSEPGRYAATASGDRFASQMVAPTLATAGLGLLTGGIPTAIAIMRPDYGSSESVAVSLEDLDAVACALAAGCCLRLPAALDRLSKIDTLVVIDDPSLFVRGLVVSRIVHRVEGDAEPLRWAASLARFLADDRRSALAQAAREKKLVLLDLATDQFGDGVAIAIRARLGKRELVLREAEPVSQSIERQGQRKSSQTATHQTAEAPLVLEIDGVPAATFEFARSLRYALPDVLVQAKERQPFTAMLVSADNEEAVAQRAQSLHFDLWRSDLNPAAVGRLIHGLREAGRVVGFVGPCSRFASAVAASDVAVDVDTQCNIDTTPAGIVSLAGKIDSLPDLFAAAHRRRVRLHSVRRLAFLPNAACVVGALFLGFTGIVAVLISNLGTLGVYTTTNRSHHANSRLRWLRNRSSLVLRRRSSEASLIHQPRLEKIAVRENQAHQKE